MHDLESAFGALVVPVISNSDVPHVPLDLGAQVVAATWLMKTWLLLEIASKHIRGGSVTSPTAMRFLYEHRRPPPGPRIFMCEWQPPAREAVRWQTTRITRQGQGATMSFLGFDRLGFVVYVADRTPGPIGGFRFTGGLERHFVEVWPYQEQEVEWPPPLVVSPRLIDDLIPDEGREDLGDDWQFIV
jgi:hypothetical protein